MVTANGNNALGTGNASGAEIVVEAAPGMTIKLPIESLQGVLFTQNSGNLIVVPADGGEPILLQDFLTFGATENPPKIELMDGEIVEISEITPLIQGYSLADINPEAGEDISDGGGANFRPFADGNIGDPLGIADLLPPTELAFARDEIEEIIGENEDIDPISDIPPDTPPPPPPPPPPGPDDPTGTVTLTFETPGGQSGPVNGGYEDWQPNQNVGDTTELPMQVVVGFTPDTDEELTSVDISGFPAGSRFFIGGTGAVNEVNVAGGSYSVLTVGGVLPAMFLLPPGNTDADIPLDVTANFQNGAGATGSADGNGIAIIDAVADVPTVSGGGSVSGDENTAIELPEISAALQDNDGSETLALSIGGVPVGATLTDGVNNFVGDGSDVDITGWDLANLTITPPTDDAADFTLTVTATATESATVAGGGELTDGNNEASTSFTIDVAVESAGPPGDDGPTAIDDRPAALIETVNTHAVFVIDTSESMDSNELRLVEEALQFLAWTMFTQNETGTAITLVEFNDEANFIGGGTYTTLESVLEALNVVSTLSNGYTNYDSALDLTRTVDFMPGYQQEIYFLSDGQPTLGDTENGINEFNSWVTNDLNGAKVYSVGIGSDALNSVYLGQIDNTPDDNNIDPPAGDPYFHVNNAEDLMSSIVPKSGWVNGNVLDNDVLGTDPLADIPIESISYKGETFTLAGSPNSTVEGNFLYIATDFGLLEMNFENGNYAFLTNTNVTGVEQEEIGYTIVDNDGSTSSAVLTITIAPDYSLMGTAADDDIDGSAINDIIIGGGGNDIFSGGDGDDQFYYSNAASDGNDAIEDFGAYGDSDVINLSAIFDRLDIASGERADHVAFSESGGNTTITVTDGSNAEIAGFSIVVENASLDSSDITNGKIVVDES